MNPSSPPPAPDPVRTAQAQGSENLRAAQQQYGLNATNQVTPYGTLNYDQSGHWEDGTPRYTATTSLSPTAQDTINKQIGVQNKFADTAGNQLDSVKGLLSSGFSLPGGAVNAGPQIDPGPAIDPNSIIPERQRIEQALYDRAAPQLDRSRAARETQLKNQGFDYGTEGWKGAIDDVNRQENDFRLGVIGQGGQEQRNIYDMMSGARAQNFGLKSASQAQKFGQDMSARGQLINEALTERNQPLTELSTLLNGSTPQQPTFQSTPQSHIDPADIAGLYGQQWQGQMQGWNAQNQANQALMGGAFGLAGAGLGGWARGAGGR